MKKKLIIAAIVIAAAALMLGHYILIETRDALPEAVRLGWLMPFRQDAAGEMARAETFRGYGPERGHLFLREAVSRYYSGSGVRDF